MAKSEPLGFFGIDNNDPKLEKINKKDAQKLIQSASLTLSWNYKEIELAVNEVDGDLNQMYFNFRGIIPRKLFNNYKAVIIHQPVELIKWAIQFINR